MAPLQFHAQKKLKNSLKSWDIEQCGDCILVLYLFCILILNCFASTLSAEKILKFQATLKQRLQRVCVWFSH